MFPSVPARQVTSIERIRALARQFPENGLKQLLHQPDNVRELLALARAPLRDRIDFGALSVDPTTYVTADYRHVSSDLVLTAPFRPASGRRRRSLSLTILLEHQSEPERLMKLRVLDYLVQIWKSQVRAWGQEHRSLASVKLRPILPVVFYTGAHRWEGLGRLIDLMDEAEGLEDLVPEFQPLFVNLPESTAASLSAVGAFGQILRLVQQRRAGGRAFQELLGEVVGQLEGLADDRLRWLELLSYAQALVYHDRAPSEHRRLEEVIDASVRTDTHRQEVSMARRTIADVFREEGVREEAVRARQEMLLVQLRERFEELPLETTQIVENTRDLARLETWIRRIVKVKTLGEIGITAQP